VRISVLADKREPVIAAKSFTGNAPGRRRRGADK